MDIGILDHDSLPEFTAEQILNLIPDGAASPLPCLRRHIDETLSRLRTCINAVKTWQVDKFDHLHSSQYSTYLYFLANTIWRKEPSSTDVTTRLFLLNKALNAIDLFYEIEMPDIFFIGHSPGVVLAKATYGNYLVLYQNSTVGRNRGLAPTLGTGVILYPNSAILGSSVIGDNTAISQGTGVISQNVAGNCIVFRQERGICVKQTQKNFASEFFRL